MPTRCRTSECPVCHPSDRAPTVLEQLEYDLGRQLPPFIRRTFIIGAANPPTTWAEAVSTDRADALGTAVESELLAQYVEEHLLDGHPNAQTPGHGTSPHGDTP